MKKHNVIIGQLSNPQGNIKKLITDRGINLNCAEDKYLNSLTKIAILTTLGAYKLLPILTIDTKFSKQVKVTQLSNFLSYIVNHPVFAPMKYDYKIVQGNNKNSATESNQTQAIEENSFITFSGGIDSTAGLLYLLEKGKSVLPITIFIGQHNEQAELSVIKKIKHKININPLILNLNISKYITGGEKTWGYIIPARNFLFLSFAATIASASSQKRADLYLCAHKDEMVKARNTDKSKYFLRNCEKYFSLMFDKQITCSTPFEKIDKTQALSYWRRNWITKFNISPHETISCHNGKGCGACDACLKRTISLLAAGFEADKFMVKHPFTDHAGLIKNHWLPMIENNKLSRVKLLDFLISIDKTNISLLPSYVQELKDKKYLEEAKAKRMREIESAVF